MRGRLRSAPRSSTRPPQRWQRPTKTRDPNWHRAGTAQQSADGSGARGDHDVLGMGAEQNPTATRGSRMVAAGDGLLTEASKGEKQKSKSFQEGKTTKTRAAWAPVGRQPGDRKNQPKLEF